MTCTFLAGSFTLRKISHCFQHCQQKHLLDTRKIHYVHGQRQTAPFFPRTQPKQQTTDNNLERA